MDCYKANDGVHPYAERLRQIADQYGQAYSIKLVRKYLQDRNFQLLPFETQDAEAVATLWKQLKQQGYTDADWHQHRFDILLCSVAYARGYTLVTNDSGKHFSLVAQCITTQMLQTIFQTTNQT